jgi:hypothetical protein
MIKFVALDAAHCPGSSRGIVGWLCSARNCHFMFAAPLIETVTHADDEGCGSTRFGITESITPETSRLPIGWTRCWASPIDTLHWYV